MNARRHVAQAVLGAAVWLSSASCVLLGGKPCAVDVDCPIGARCADDGFCAAGARDDEADAGREGEGEGEGDEDAGVLLLDAGGDVPPDAGVLEDDAGRLADGGALADDAGGGDDAGGVADDAGASADAGSPIDDDAGAGGDAGADGDAGTDGDAGGGASDAGNATPDAGNATPDAGNATPDAGNAVADSGQVVDAGECTALTLDVVVLGSGVLETDEGGGPGFLGVTVTGIDAGGAIVTFESSDPGEARPAVSLLELPLNANGMQLEVSIFGVMDMLRDGAQPFSIVVSASPKDCPLPVASRTVSGTNLPQEGVLFTAAVLTTGDLKDSSDYDLADAACTAAGTSPTARAVIVGNGRSPSVPSSWVLAASTAYFRPDDSFITMTTADGVLPLDLAEWDQPITADAYAVWSGFSVSSTLVSEVPGCSNWTAELSNKTGTFARSDQMGGRALFFGTATCNVTEALLCVDSL